MGARPRASASVSQTRPGSIGSSGASASTAGSTTGGSSSGWPSMASAISGQSRPKHTPGYGLAAAVTATPATSNERRFTTRQSGCSPRIMSPHTRVCKVISSPTLSSSASAKPASTTTPPSRTQPPWVSFGLVDRGRCGVAALRPHARSTDLLPAHFSSGDALRFQLCPDERVRSAVADDAGSVGQRLEARRGRRADRANAVPARHWPPRRARRWPPGCSRRARR